MHRFEARERSQSHKVRARYSPHPIRLRAKCLDYGSRRFMVHEHAWLQLFMRLLYIDFIRFQQYFVSLESPFALVLYFLPRIFSSTEQTFCARQKLSSVHKLHITSFHRPTICARMLGVTQS